MNELFPNPTTTIDPRLEQQIAKNHARVRRLPDITVPGLLADWERQQAADRRALDLARAAGAGLPLFAE